MKHFLFDAAAVHRRAGRPGRTVLLAALILLAYPASAVEPPVGPDDRFSDVVMAPVPQEPWWVAFDDPQLVALVAAALRGNHGLAAAEQRLAQAVALRSGAAAPFWPTVSLNAGGSMAPYASRGAAFGGIPDRPDQPPAPEHYYAGSVLLGARLGLDVWGRQYLRYRAARQQAQASEDDRDLVAMLLAFQVGEAYFDAVASAEQLAVLMEQVARNADLLEVIELRFKRGEATAIDVLQQKQQLAAARARVPIARGQRRLHRQRLAVLIGRSPTGRLPITAVAQPSLPPSPGVGTPLALLDNRPDLRAAQQRARALTHQADATLGRHLPRLALTGQAGRQYYRAREWIGTQIWTAGVELSVPLFSGGADAAAVDQAQATARAALASLSQATLEAVSGVQGTVVTEAEQKEQRDAVTAQLEAAQQAFDESRARYVAGVGNYLSVFTALNALHQAQLSLLAAQRALIGARLKLRHAVGGRWTVGLRARDIRGAEAVQTERVAARSEPAARSSAVLHRAPWIASGGRP